MRSRWQRIWYDKSIISCSGTLTGGEYPTKSSLYQITIIDSRHASTDSFGSNADSNFGSSSGFKCSYGLETDFSFGRVLTLTLARDLILGRTCGLLLQVGSLRVEHLLLQVGHLTLQLLSSVRCWITFIF